MTSKEKFILLYNQIIYKSKEYQQNCEFRNLQTHEKIECKALIELILKDLEVLEILKKYMWFSFHEELGFQIFCNDKIDLGNEEEFKLLKEYLNG